MASNIGTATIDFGAYPGSNEASVVVSDATIVSGAKVEAFMEADNSTVDHTASDHRYFNSFAGLTAGSVVASTGFTIYATSEHKFSGTFQVDWVWSD